MTETRKITVSAELVSFAPALALTAGVYWLREAWISIAYFPVIWGALSLAVELARAGRRGRSVLEFTTQYWLLTVLCVLFFGVWAFSQGLMS